MVDILSFSLKNANTSSYARFIKTLVGIFDKKIYETHVVKQNKSKQTKTFHVMEETIKPNPLQKTMEEANILHYTLLEARPSSCILAQEGKRGPFSKIGSNHWRVYH